MSIIPYGKQTISQEDIEEVIKVLSNDFLTTGPKVKEFEEKIAQYCDVKYCVALSNGTAALHLASIILLNENDKVLTTPNSFLATANSILYVNAKPIFVDITEDGNIDLDLCEIELKKDKNIKAIYLVHLTGNPVNQDKIKYLKETYNIKILEDCAHAFGSSFNGVKTGSCQNSDICTFSFHPVKHITTGEGGAITTNCEKTYEKLLQLRSHGMKADPSVAPWHYDMVELGFNYRLTDISCALGISQLKRIEEFVNLRKNIAQTYDKYFENIKNIEPLYKFTNNSSYHLYVVKIDFEKFGITKKDFVLKMREKDIYLQYHYTPINKQSFYKNLGFGKEITPIMDDYYKKAISLPIYPNLTSQEQEFVFKAILEILNIK